MSRATPAQYAFTGGEISPRIKGRTDLERIRNAVEEMTNMVAVPEGPSERRPGTRFANSTKGDASAVLIPFEFSTQQAYIIEATAGAFRFYRDGGQIVSGSSPYEVTHAYSAADLPFLRWTQSADVLFLVCPGHPPRTLSRTGHTAWNLAEWVMRDGPYLDLNSGPTTLTPSGTSGSVTLTASAALFAATDVGRLVRLRIANVWGWCRITAFGSVTSVTATVEAAWGGTTATAFWRLGAWGATTGTWPTAVTFHENRLAFAALQTVWLSCSGDFDNFGPTTENGTVAADNAITLTAADDQVNVIRWLRSAFGVLIAGTSGGPFAIQASSLREALTPINATMPRVHVAGAADVQPVRVATNLVFPSRSRRRLHLLNAEFAAAGYSAPDLALVASHITRHAVKAMAYQQEPWSVMWLVLDDGTLAGVTYVPELDILAWHRHPLGGTAVKVLSVACIPAADRDELWLVVERVVAGGIRRHVEILEAPFEPATAADRAGCYFVDAGLSYAGPPVTSLSGLAHLEGETVQILADGAVHPDRLVTGGQVALQVPASQVHVGLGTAARVVSLDPGVPVAEGASRGKPRRIDQVTVGLLNSQGGSVGLKGGPAEKLPVRHSGDVMGAPSPLFSGDMAIKVESGWSRAVQVVAEQTLPLPLTLSAIVPRISTMDA
ncbi:hypothetical protein AZL_025410 [Azospirillum sp. B510]|uniref:hypothetical protein n=1 Tax=Azospirillum sp. (strain B510) TaxID=137722 RepID=UPI0001C4CBEB|nr:hypothetical protein [Azospirillum sp. B510]BAI73179.1 hypothetical protein AZL_025410 [Azospirillum sp. B510]